MKELINIQQPFAEGEATLRLSFPTTAAELSATGYTIEAIFALAAKSAHKRAAQVLNNLSKQADTLAPEIALAKWSAMEAELRKGRTTERRPSKLIDKVIADIRDGKVEPEKAKEMANQLASAIRAQTPAR